MKTKILFFLIIALLIINCGGGKKELPLETFTIDENNQDFILETDKTKANYGEFKHKGATQSTNFTVPEGKKYVIDYKNFHDRIRLNKIQVSGILEVKNKVLLDIQDVNKVNYPDLKVLGGKLIFYKYVEIVPQNGAGITVEKGELVFYGDVGIYADFERPGIVNYDITRFLGENLDINSLGGPSIIIKGERSYTYISQNTKEGFIISRTPRRIKLDKNITAIPWQEIDLLL